jgi:hypothetical protein
MKVARFNVRLLLWPMLDLLSSIRVYSRFCPPAISASLDSHAPPAVSLSFQPARIAVALPAVNCADDIAVTKNALVDRTIEADRGNRFSDEPIGCS